MSLNTYYTLGRSGLRVSRLALGAMTFGTEWGWGADEAIAFAQRPLCLRHASAIGASAAALLQIARQMFNTYVDAGGNFIDTADSYTNGTSETWLGKFIAERNLRERVVVATKFSYNADLPISCPSI